MFFIYLLLFIIPFIPLLGLRQKKQNDTLEALLKNMPETNKWFDTLINIHYPRNKLPIWVKHNKFCKHLKNELIKGIKYNVNKFYSQDISIESWLTQLYSVHIDMGSSAGLEGKISKNSYMIQIPIEVVREFISNNLIEISEDKLKKTEESTDPVTERNNEIKNLLIKGDKIMESLKSVTNKEDLKKLTDEFNVVMQEVKTKKRKLSTISNTPYSRTNSSSGFLKPVKISKEMAEFFNLDVNKLYSRVEITKLICSYIKDNQLFNSENHREIIPNEKLATLLNYKKIENEEFTYFRLQRYLQPHFIKTN